MLLSLIVLLASCASEEVDCIEEEKEVAEAVVPMNGKSGEHQEFFPSGKLQMEGTLLKGQRIGKWTAYFENGNKMSENEYKNGKRHGMTVAFYESGLKRYIGYFNEDERSGNWIFFKPDGQVDREENFNKK